MPHKLKYLEVVAPGPGRLVLRLPGVRLAIPSRRPVPPEPRTVKVPGTNGATKHAQGEVRKCLDGLGLMPGDLVLVACSGGADSLALAAVAQRAAHSVGKTTRKKGFAIRVGAVIVDHQLQPGSAQVAEYAAAQCEKLGLSPVRIVTAQVPKKGAGGLEAAARAARYQALEQVAAELGAKAVLLGHTLDDQAESVLLGLARGSGARSLSGIPYQRYVSQQPDEAQQPCVLQQSGVPQQGVVFVRPFLQVRRSTTEFLCEWYRLTPWHDPTNAQPVHLRNRIRLNVMPVLHDAVGPGVAEALARTAEQLAEDADALDHYAIQLLHAANPNRHSARSGDPVGITAETQNLGLDVPVLMQAPVAVRRRALRMAALAAGAIPSDLNRAQVLAMDALVANWHGQSPHNLPGGVIVRREGGKLWFD